MEDRTGYLLQLLGVLGVVGQGSRAGLQLALQICHLLAPGQQLSLVLLQQGSLLLVGSLQLPDAPVGLITHAVQLCFQF